MSIRFPAAPGLLILIAGIIIRLGIVARLYQPERLVVWHDEVFTQMRVFGFDEGRVSAEVFSGRDLSPGDLLACQRPSPAQGWAETMASLMTHPEHSPLYYLAARLAALPAFAALELAVAWVLAAGWDATSRGTRSVGRTGVFLVLGAALEAGYDLEPVLNTWQWMCAVPRAKGGRA